MGKLKVWSKKLNDEIELKKEEIFKRDYKFFKIDRLERINERIDIFSDDCEQCQNFKKEAEDIVSKLPAYINGTPGMRGEYEKRTEKIVKHLKHKHGLVPEQYYSSIWSFTGLLSGTLIFGFTAYLINNGFLKWGLFLGFTIGIIAGRIYGNRKDKFKQNSDLIL
ncbi:MAG: hypothetical protein L3J56_05675 [Bacteroidales bacterium]|nr:hypothetical protein [Bacteroidales bacterium]